jgi:hypothetical protein
MPALRKRMSSLFSRRWSSSAHDRTEERSERSRGMCVMGQQFGMRSRREDMAVLVVEGLRERM